MGCVACKGKIRSEYEIFVEKPQDMRPVGRQKHRWEVNMKMDHTEVGCEYMDWIQLAQ
jgi:hypothetical protein